MIKQNEKDLIIFKYYEIYPRHKKYLPNKVIVRITTKSWRSICSGKHEREKRLKNKFAKN